MEIVLVNALEKVFWDKRPPCALCDPAYHVAAMGGTFSFQAAVYAEAPGMYSVCTDYVVEIISDIADVVRVRQVGHVPSRLPAYPGVSKGYLRDTAGFYPDVLEEVTDGKITVINGRWNSIWIDVTPIKRKTPPGTHTVTVVIRNNKNEAAAQASTTVRVLDADIPESPFLYTNWFHTDCLAQYYDVEVFSEEYWRIVKNFMEAAANTGVTMILTPVFTPPLDTAVGGERLTVQLVDVEFVNGLYTFGFDKLSRWIDTAESAGIRYLEISHLFTQWGAAHAPKIMVRDEHGALKLKFGWETDAAGDEYVTFLRAFIPALKVYLNERDILKRTYFHISDEPNADTLPQYRRVHAVMKPLLADGKVFDALSDPAFYHEGLVEIPVIATDHYDAFGLLPLRERWVYYCCAQAADVSNRFFAMPGARTRILGVQLYLHEITGFLHWGLNFYNTRNSVEAIDPYLVTDAGGAFPSGDAFILYPGTGGRALDSVRAMAFKAGLDDYHALKYLEGIAGRDFVVSLIYEGVNEEITFTKYPADDGYLMKLRARMLDEIIKRQSPF
jgi:hypothetical protein